MKQQLIDRMENRPPTYSTFKVENMQALENLIMDMPKAEGRAVYTSRTALADVPVSEMFKDVESTAPATDLILDRERKAIVNTRTDKTAQIAGAGYQILPHSDYYCAVADLHRQRGLGDAHGFLIVTNGGNRMKLRLIYDNSEIEEPGRGRNIKVGGEFINSYDSTNAASGRAFYLRMSCVNQMVIRNIIAESVFSRAHSAASRTILLEAVTIELENYLDNLARAGMTFKRSMVNAIGDQIFIESPEQLELFTKQVFKTDIHAEGIAAIAKRMAVPVAGDPRLHVMNRWDLYNAATQYASHESIVTPNVQDSIFYRAEVNILKSPIELPPVPIKTK